jgi:hypothetical protein
MPGRKTPDIPPENSSTDIRANLKVSGIAWELQRNAAVQNYCAALKIFQCDAGACLPQNR